MIYLRKKNLLLLTSIFILLLATGCSSGDSDYNGPFVPDTSDTGTGTSDTGTGTSDTGTGTSDTGTGTSDTGTGTSDTGTGTSDTGTGTGDTGTGTGSDPVSCTGITLGSPYTVYEGGYVVSGSLHGYAFTWADTATSSIAPANYANLTAGAALCASGTVGPLDDSTALLGINVQQTCGQEAKGTIVPTGNGLYVDVTSSTAGSLRIQIQGPNGDTDENQRWCAPIGDGAQFVAWESFNTQCWQGGDGNAYNMEPLAAMMILVPGNPQRPYNFCINEISIDSGTDTGSPSSCGQGGGTISGGPYTTVAQYETYQLTIGGKAYKVQTNAWGSGHNQQTMVIGGSNVFSLTRQEASSTTDVQTYPSVYRGAAQGDPGGTSSSGMPIQVSSINELCTGFSTNSTSVSGRLVSTYDIYFTNSQQYSGGPPDVFLMVWLDRRDGFNPTVNGVSDYTCGGDVPHGIDSCTYATNIQIPGAGTFHLFVGNNHEGKRVFSYVRSSYTNSLRFDIKDFINDAVSRGQGLTNSMYLQSVQAGFEIKSGGAGLVVDDFYVLVNGN